MGTPDMERDTAVAFIGEPGTIPRQEPISIGIFDIKPCRISRYGGPARQRKMLRTFLREP
jgi:hypothetical protein